MPALLQTKTYAEAIIGSVPRWLASEQQYRAVVTYLERQAHLNDPSKRFRFLISQGALQHWFGPRSAFVEQLQALLGVFRRRNVEIRCIRPGGELSRAILGPFTVLDNELVQVDTPTGMVLLRGPREIIGYTDLFDALWDDALQNDDVVAVIKDALTQLEEYEDTAIDLRDEADLAHAEPS